MDSVLRRECSETFFDKSHVEQIRVYTMKYDFFLPGFLPSRLFRGAVSNYIPILFVLVVTVFITGCATSSVFSPYPYQVAEYKTRFAKGDVDKVLKKLDSQKTGQDAALYSLERGRFAQIAGQTDSSISSFNVAIEYVKREEEKAKITASGIAAQSASLVTNDNAIPYLPSAYERVLLYQYQAMNYLAKKDYEGALVEVRRANQEQEDALNRHEKELIKAEEEAKKNNYNPQQNASRLNNAYLRMNQAVADVKSSFQNGYTYYVTGMLYELAGAANDAYIDYKRCYGLNPKNEYVQADLLRLSKKLGFAEDYQMYAKQFSITESKGEQNYGDIIVIFEDGYVPIKEEARLSLATFSGIHTVAFPIYNDYLFNAHSISLAYNNRQLGTSQPVANIHALAIKALQEQIPAIAVRQILRVISKDRMRREAESRLGGAAGFAAIVYNIVSETADRRSWLTLPRSAQIIRTQIPLGEQTVRVALDDGLLAKELQVNIREGKPAVIWVVNAGNRLYTTIF